MDNTSKEIFSLETMASDLQEAERFADYLEKQGLYSAPHNLKSSILSKSRQTDIRLIAKTGQLSKKTELFFYGLKIGFAVACCVAALAAIPPLYRLSPPAHMEYSPIYIEAYEKMQEWNGKIDSFSKSLLNLEVPFYD